MNKVLHVRTNSLYRTNKYIEHLEQIVLREQKYLTLKEEMIVCSEQNIEHNKQRIVTNRHRFNTIGAETIRQRRYVYNKIIKRTEREILKSKVSMAKVLGPIMHDKLAIVSGIEKRKDNDKTNNIKEKGKEKN